MSRLKYTAEHLEFLRAEYQSMNTRDLTKALNKRFNLDKTETAIGSVLTKHGIKCGRAPKDRLINRFKSRIFNGDQIKFIRENYTDKSIAEMTALFNKHFNTDRTVKQILTATKNRGIVSGRTGNFPKGNKPWNTGLKGVMKPNSGNFPKGNIPANIKPLGSERKTKDGFIEIKVAEFNPYTGFSTRYKHKHIHIYEQKNGPVQNGMVVAFKDSNKSNCDPKNLMLISRAELLMLNRHGYKEMPAELKPSVLALSKLKVKARAIEKEITA